MEGDTSTYQAFKLWVTGYVPLERDMLHWLIGAAIIVLVLLFARKPLRTKTFIVPLILALAIGCAMELADRRDDLASLGNWRWRASVLDVLRTIALPAMACCIAGFMGLWRKR